MATGDIGGNVLRLVREAKAIKYPGEVDEIGLRLGDPVALLPILSFALLKFSRHVARYIVKNGFELQGKTDQRFLEGSFKLFRDVLGLKTVLTPSQFFEQGFAERKVLLACDVIAVCKKLHNDEVRKERLAALKGTRPEQVASRLAPSTRKSPEIKVIRHDDVEVRRLYGAQHLPNATDGAQSVFKQTRQVTTSRSPSPQPSAAAAGRRSRSPGLRPSSASPAGSHAGPLLKAPLEATLRASTSQHAHGALAAGLPIHTWFLNPAFDELPDGGVGEPQRPGSSHAKLASPKAGAVDSSAWWKPAAQPSSLPAAAAAHAWASSAAGALPAGQAPGMQRAGSQQQQQQSAWELGASFSFSTAPHAQRAQPRQQMPEVTAGADGSRAQAAGGATQAPGTAGGGSVMAWGGGALELRPAAQMHAVGRSYGQGGRLAHDSDSDSHNSSSEDEDDTAAPGGACHDQDQDQGSLPGGMLYGSSSLHSQGRQPADPGRAPSGAPLPAAGRGALGVAARSEPVTQLQQQQWAGGAAAAGQQPAAAVTNAGGQAPASSAQLARMEQELQHQLQDLQARLAQAEAELERTKVEAQQAKDELQARVTVLEGRVRFLECEMDLCVKRAAPVTHGSPTAREAAGGGTYSQPHQRAAAAGPLGAASAMDRSVQQQMTVSTHPHHHDHHHHQQPQQQQQDQWQQQRYSWEGPASTAAAAPAAQGQPHGPRDYDTHMDPPTAAAAAAGLRAQPWARASGGHNAHLGGSRESLESEPGSAMAAAASGQHTAAFASSAMAAAYAPSAAPAAPFQQHPQQQQLLQSAAGLQTSYAGGSMPRPPSAGSAAMPQPSFAFQPSSLMRQVAAAAQLHQQQQQQHGTGGSSSGGGASGFEPGNSAAARSSREGLPQGQGPQSQPSWSDPSAAAGGGASSSGMRASLGGGLPPGAPLAESLSASREGALYSASGGAHELSYGGLGASTQQGLSQGSWQQPLSESGASQLGGGGGLYGSVSSSGGLRASVLESVTRPGQQPQHLAASYPSHQQHQQQTYALPGGGYGGATAGGSGSYGGPPTATARHAAAPSAMAMAAATAATAAGSRPAAGSAAAAHGAGSAAGGGGGAAGPGPGGGSTGQLINSLYLRYTEAQDFLQNLRQPDTGPRGSGLKRW